MKKQQMSIRIMEKFKIFTSYLLFFKDIKKISKLLVVAAILILISVSAKTPTIAKDISETEKLEMYYPEMVRLRLHKDLISEVEDYIKTVAPTSLLKADTIVILSQEFNLDITFVLAQAYIESHLGTRGKAATTKSVFNVGSFDDGQTRHRYKNVNESVRPYMKLISEKYLVNNKTVKDLIKNGGFVNEEGRRYATSLAYESNLKTAMLNIEMSTSISMYQDVINLSDNEILSYFGPSVKGIIVDSSNVKTLSLKTKLNDATKSRF